MRGPGAGRARSAARRQGLPPGRLRAHRPRPPSPPGDRRVIVHPSTTQNRTNWPRSPQCSSPARLFTAFTSAVRPCVAPPSQLVPGVDHARGVPRPTCSEVSRLLVDDGGGGPRGDASAPRPALLTADRERGRGRDRPRRRGRRSSTGRSRTRSPTCSPGRRRSPPTCDSSSPPCTSPPTSSGWATSPSTWPRPRCAGTRRRRCPPSCGRSFTHDGRRRRPDRRQDQRRCSPSPTRPARPSWSATTTRWTSCTSELCSWCCSAPTGRTASRPRSTARCSGRFYERYADHAVNAGHHVIYLVTGEHGRRNRQPRRTPTPEAQRPWLATAAAASLAASGSR